MEKSRPRLAANRGFHDGKEFALLVGPAGVLARLLERGQPPDSLLCAPAAVGLRIARYRACPVVAGLLQFVGVTINRAHVIERIHVLRVFREDATGSVRAAATSPVSQHEAVWKIVRC